MTKCAYEKTQTDDRMLRFEFLPPYIQYLAEIIDLVLDLFMLGSQTEGISSPICQQFLTFFTFHDGGYNQIRPYLDGPWEKRDSWLVPIGLYVVKHTKPWPI